MDGLMPYCGLRRNDKKKKGCGMRLCTNSPLGRWDAERAGGSCISTERSALDSEQKNVCPTARTACAPYRHFHTPPFVAGTTKRRTKMTNFGTTFVKIAFADLKE
jgi:hypothetical protein